MKHIYHIYIRKLRVLTRQQILFGSLGIIIGVSVVCVRPVFANEGLVGQVVEMLKEKVGFGYSLDSTEYIFEKETPNYKAFSGTQNPFGGHRIVLERDGTSVELAFLTANALDERLATGVLGESVVALTPQEDTLLADVEGMLIRESSASAQGRIPLPDSFFTSFERDRIASAASLLNRIDPVLGEATGSGQLALSREAQDFALLIRIKSFRIAQHELDIDMKLAAVNRDLSAIMSQATLKEEPSERVVTFHNIAMGADLDYRLRESGIRQQVVLRDAEKRYKNFIFLIKKSGLTVYDVGGGVWYFRTRTGADIMRIPKGYATDAAGTFTNNVDLVITEQPDVGEVMVVSVSPDWLAAPERVFPVVVETSLEITPEFRDGKNGVGPSVTSNPTATGSPTPMLLPSPTGIPAMISGVPSLEPVPESSNSATLSGEGDVSYE